MKLRLAVDLRADGSPLRVGYFKTVDWPAVPRVGDALLLAGDDSGWSEDVRLVWWDATSDDGAVQVEIGPSLGVVDRHGEDLEGTLRDAGWTMEP